MAKRNMLSNRDLIIVSRYLDKRREALEGLTPDTLIASIKEGTGVEMTRGNLEGIRSIEGYEWVIPPRKKAGDVPSEREKALGKALLGLYERLGDEPPEELLEIAHG